MTSFNIDIKYENNIFTVSAKAEILNEKMGFRQLPKSHLSTV